MPKVVNWIRKWSNNGPTKNVIYVRNDQNFEKCPTPSPTLLLSHLPFNKTSFLLLLKVHVNHEKFCPKEYFFFRRITKPHHQMLNEKKIFRRLA